MPSKVKIYTKTGDKGLTSLYGGKRVSKDNIRVSAYGTIDELNSCLGIVISGLKIPEINSLLEKIQSDLFSLGANLAGNKQDLSFVPDRVFQMEKMIDSFDKDLPELKNFILPGGNMNASLLHLSRSVCRRAEREVVRLAGEEKNVDSQVIIYLNRLSDLLFVMARYSNHFEKRTENIWKSS